mgnify:CR=1 FL=1
MADHELNAQSLKRLEAVIGKAGCYVHPRDELRPRTIEAARTLAARRRGQRRLLACAAAILLAAMTGGHSWSTAWRNNPAAGRPLAAAARLGGDAREVSLAARVDPSWGLYEAFLELRHYQAASLTGKSPPAPASD